MTAKLEMAYLVGAYVNVLSNAQNDERARFVDGTLARFGRRAA